MTVDERADSRQYTTNQSRLFDATHRCCALLDSIEGPSRARRIIGAANGRETFIDSDPPCRLTRLDHESGPPIPTLIGSSDAMQEVYRTDPPRRANQRFGVAAG